MGNYKKIKIIGGDNVGWSIDKDKEHMEFFLNKAQNVKIVNNYLSANICFFVWYSQLLNKSFLHFRIFKKIFKKKKIIAFITNDIKNNIDVFYKIFSLVDLWLSPNSNTSNFLEKKGVCYRQIPFYVSPRKFYKIKRTKRETAKKIGINFSRLSKKIIIGSFQRDSLGEDLSKPKWQKNPELLIKILEKIKKDSLLILAGPRRHFVINQCRERNIPYLFVGDERLIDKKKDDIAINNLSQEKINLLYNLIDFYLVTSKSEGGPKAILEASLSKTLVFSTSVGLAKDFLHPDLIYSEKKIDNLILFIRRVYKNKNEIEKYKECNYKKALSVLNEEKYLKLITEIINSV
jgi:hypothetical protein